jgi:hypothetical protein
MKTLGRFNSPSYKQGINENRINYLLRFPSLLQIAMNSSNKCMLREIISDTFTNDCLVKIFFTNTFKVGRDKLYESHTEMLRLIPDVCIVSSPPILNEKELTITYEHIVTGTSGKIFGLPSNSKTETINPFKIPTELMDDNLRLQSEKYDNFMSQNKLFSFQLKAIITLQLNEDMTHFEKRIASGICLYQISDSD